MLKGCDTSNNNGSVNHQLIREHGGCSFEFAKMSEGDNFIDSYWVGGRPQSIRAAGMRVGGYHFARPASNSARDEALHAIRALDAGGGYRKGDLPVTIDFEDSFLPTKRANRVWLEEFATYIRRHTGRGCILYGSSSLLDEHLDVLPSDCRTVWIASYPSLIIPAVVRRSGGKVLFHQWTDRAHIDGIHGGADADVFYGSKWALRRFCR